MPLRRDDGRDLRSWVTVETVPILLLLLCGLGRLALSNALVLVVMVLCAVMLLWIVRLFHRQTLPPRR
jgi:hypothetical protein